MKLEKELTYNRHEIVVTGNSIDDDIKNSEENLKHLKELAEKAENTHPLLGGIFSVSVADGKVFYQITEIKGKTAYANRCAGICLDEYSDMILGDGAWIPLNKANDFVVGYRALVKLFTKKN